MEEALIHMLAVVALVLLVFSLFFLLINIMVFTRPNVAKAVLKV